MNSQIEILKIQKRKFINQHDFSKKKLKISIEFKMIESANKVKNLDVLQDYCLDRWNFYKPTPIFKTKVNYDFCEYLVDELDPLVDSSVVESTELKLCSDCTIKKKEALFNSIRQLKDSIYVN
ncbi:33627_t:CDS:2 [Gigaspora margarita]|uniref:33627_t:CDS:1 n=1 Tax=Gigaspora margarita TaxID=4874 RepID=A0ABN7VDG7_GIGMA|nr:33627_t:CDS:2 [Gigaspora margarita]